MVVIGYVDLKAVLKLAVANLVKRKLGKKVLSQRSKIVNSDLEGFKWDETIINKDFLIIVRNELTLRLNTSLTVVKNIYFSF